MTASSPIIRLAGFALVLALVFGGAALAGDAVGPSPASPQKKDHAAMTTSTYAEHDVRGLAVAENGLRLEVDRRELRRGRTEALRFRIVDARGRVVRDFDDTHTKRMHAILVRRDLTGFQHVHPEQWRDGTWTTAVRVADAGSYRLFADFARAGENHTLAADLRVDGAAELRPVPDPREVATSDGGYDVRLTSRDVEAGEPAELRFEITREGQPVEVEEYLGARGHLVALRDGDLAFLHVHPHDDETAFEATFPTAGRYRLFLQFQHRGEVQTVAFTQDVS
jgi:hypothetical protein